MTEAIARDRGAAFTADWPRLTIGAALLAAAVAAAWPAWADIALFARRDAEASHIWLVPVVAGWLIWARRDRLRRTPVAYSLLGPAVIALGAIVGYAGFHHAIQAFWHGGAVLMAAGAVLSVTGWRWWRAAWPAAVVLVLLVPVPGSLRQQIAMPLQTATAGAAHYIFGLLGSDVSRQGNVLRYQGVDVAVAEACNGMRMVFTLLLVCYTVAFAWPVLAPVRALLLLLSPVCAIVCNVIRLVPTVWLYGHWPDTAGPVFHDLSGWGMVFVAFGLALGMLGLLGWLGLPVEREPQPIDHKDNRPEDDPHKARGWPFPGPKTPRALLTLALAGVVLLAVHVEALARPRPTDAAAFHAAVRQAVMTMPLHPAGWVGRDVPTPPEAVQLLRPNALLSRHYHDPATGRQATMLIVHTGDARDMAGHYPPNCYPAHGWRQDSARPRDLRLADATLPATAYRFHHGPGAAAGRAMRVTNFLILPTGEVVPDIAAVRRAAADYTRHFHGAAQVQLITADDLPAGQRQAIEHELLEAHRDLLDLLRRGPAEDGA